ncbi:MAG: Ig-like domain-containing protein [Gemmatimonadota bacterium]|nr:Ig-like domain-containing protein [Gemmatimonadota bacterium]MDE2865053.1 Ig-like domain-containing protein [Gemmatimonadota bacterium]
MRHQGCDGSRGRRIAGFTHSAMAAGVIALLVLSCGDGAVEPTPPPPAPVATTITVNPGSASLSALRETARFTAEVRDQNGQVMAGVAVAWTSSDASVASVDASGLATAAGNGSATITATAGSVSGAAAVTVAQVVSAVAVSPAADTLVAFGDTVRMVAEATDANGHAVAAVTEFVWSTSDTLVARVDETGLVESFAEGQAAVMATTSEVTGGAELVVVAPLPTTVAMSPDTVAFTALGQTVQLAAEVRDQLARVMADLVVSWSSGDTLVAVVDSSGLVTAMRGGTTSVTAGVGDVSDSVVVTVTQSAGSVVVSPAAGTIALGDTLRLAAEAFDENGHSVDGVAFSWSSSDAGVAQVDDSGLVEGVGEGTARIRAVAGGASGVAEITVDNPDRAALVVLYEATDGPDWINNENWLTDAALGDWHGVETDGAGRVRWLSLRSNALTGAIPSELGNLTHLDGLFLDSNALSGSIPPELGSLTRLLSLYLDNNPLSGPIPVEFARLQHLRNVFLPGGVCVPDELLEWAVDRSISAFPCNSGGRLLPSALMREDGNGLSLALPDDLREPSALTVSDPGVVAASAAGGWLELVPRGRGTAEVEVVPSGGGDPAHARVVVRAAVGSFGIDIVMERPAPVTFERALIVAADWWSGLLDGTEWPDLRPTCFNDRATAIADELLIHAGINPDIRYAGYAQTCFRIAGQQVAVDDPGIPSGGRVVANPSNANPFLVQHEMGHLLGLVLWGPETGLVTGDRAYFVGPRAVEAFRASGGDADLPGVPIIGPHWGSGVRDFMAAPGDGSQVVISAAALADAGYTVDMTRAKPINP